MGLLAAYLGWFGIQTIPVRPFQLVPVIVAGFFGFVMHPTAMFCLSRPASWWGTKTLPLISVVAVNGSISVFFSSIVFSTNVWLWLLPAYILLLAITCWAAIDAWEKLSLNPPAAQSQPNGWRVNGILIAGSIVCTLIALQFITPLASFFNPSQRREYELKFDINTGEPWAVSIRPEDLLKSDVVKRDGSAFGSKIEHGIVPSEFSLIPKKLALREMQNFTEYNFSRSMFRYTNHDGFFNSKNPIWTSVIDSRGYLLRYSVIDRLNPRLDSIVDRDGIHSPDSLPGKRFSDLREIPSGPSGLRAFYDENGVYALQQYRSNAHDMRLNTLVEGNVLAASLTTIPIKSIQRLVVVVDGEIREYQLLDENDSEKWALPGYHFTSIDDDGKAMSLMGELQAIRAKLIQSVVLPSPGASRKPHGFLRTESGYVVWVDSFPPKYFLLGFDGTSQEIPIPSNNLNSNAWSNPTLAMMPPASSLVGGVASYIYCANRGESAEYIASVVGHKSTLAYLMILGIFFVMISMGIVNRMLRKRGIAGNLRWAWLLTCIPLGIATPLVVASIYAVRVREKCASCGQLRSVDLEHCEVCSAGWPISEQEGIEVFDTDANLIGQGEVCAGV
jgi:hypothetical protein